MLFRSVIGSFPPANCRTLDELDGWLGRMASEAADAAPFAPNLIVHHTNKRLPEDTDLVVKHRAPLVIASVGSPAPIVDRIKSYGGLVFADIASMRHAEKAIATGVDGLVLLTAGAGGQTGWANPFAFVRAVRAIYDGTIVLSGGLSDGIALRAAQGHGGPQEEVLGRGRLLARDGAKARAQLRERLGAERAAEPLRLGLGSFQDTVREADRALVVQIGRAHV